MSAALSYAQLKAALWAQRSGRVHAVIDGLVVPGLPQRLAGADTLGWDCLRRGALSATAAEQAAYVVELGAQAAFTDWLLGDATTAFPGWGVLAVSQQPLLAMREHCRDLSDVVTPDGERRHWRWHDPEVLEVLLASASAGQLDEVFAAGQSFVVVRPAEWTWHGLRDGVLDSQARPRMAGAA